MDEWESSGLDEQRGRIHLSSTLNQSTKPKGDTARHDWYVAIQPHLLFPPLPPRAPGGGGRSRL